MEKILKKRRKDTHKGDYGHLFIIGGSPGLTGAVCLSSMAALRSGAGLVTVGIPSGLNGIIEIKLTEVMSLPLPETSDHFFSEEAIEPALKFAHEKSDGVVIGPGISLKEATKRFVKKVIERVEKPLLVDADALKIISEELEILKKRKYPTILTPHPGEMYYLTKIKKEDIQKNREKISLDFAKKYNVIIVLKGHRTVITDGEKLEINLTGNPGMATAGSGDVLSGIIGALLVQKIPPYISTKKGVYIHGLAGDIASREKGEISLIASDIIEKLPEVFTFLQTL